MLIPKGLTAYAAFVCLSVSASCQFPLVFYSFLRAVGRKRLFEGASKNIPQTQSVCVFLMASCVFTVWHIPEEASSRMLLIQFSFHMSLQATMSSQHPPLMESCTSQVRRGTTTQAGSLFIAWTMKTKLSSHRVWKENRWVSCFSLVFGLKGIVHQSVWKAVRRCFAELFTFFFLSAVILANGL